MSPDHELPTAIMIGLRPARASVGTQPFANDSWLWRHFAQHTFDHERDYFDCHDLPSLSELLCIPAVAKADAVALTVQVVTGPGLAHAVRRAEGQMPAKVLFPQPDTCHVPRSLVDSLVGLLDCSRTGDVRIIVRERGLVLSGSGGGDGEISASQVLPYPIGTPWSSSLPETAEVVVRDRILYAHSAVLKARSCYFASMLDSDYSEVNAQSSQAGVHGGWRGLATLTIPDADYATVYWMLRFLYAGEVSFVEDEDVKEAIMSEDLAVASAAHIAKQSDGSGSATAFLHRWTRVGDLVAYEEQLYNETMERAQQLSLAEASVSREDGPSTSTLSSRRSTGSMNAQETPASPRAADSAAGPSAPTYASSRGTRFASSSSSVSSHADNLFRAASGGTSQMGARERHVSEPGAYLEQSNHPNADLWADADAADFDDPHVHPSEPLPPPASALAMYKLAHRYGQTELTELTKRHLIASLMPGNAFAVLLATSLYSDVHIGVRDYVCEYRRAFGRSSHLNLS